MKVHIVRFSESSPIQLERETLDLSKVSSIVFTQPDGMEVVVERLRESVMEIRSKEGILAVMAQGANAISVQAIQWDALRREMAENIRLNLETTGSKSRKKKARVKKFCKMRQG
jgi:arginyl-tRNA synthetase